MPGMSHADFETATAAARERVLNHPLFQKLDTPVALRVFMEHHAFAVWDFMALLKCLQQKLTCVEVPWKPVGDARARRLVNEIVLAEESDMDAEGRPASHYELYLEAMGDLGADITPVEGLVAAGLSVDDLAAARVPASVPAGAREFLRTTFAIIAEGDAASVAAAFTYGREDLIPEMFLAIVAGLEAGGAGVYPRLKYYMQRHIELDGDEHGGMARELTAGLCATPAQKSRAIATAVRALEARATLWDAVLDAIRQL